MGKTLIVAEKPSQAREYAKTLGVKSKKEGYFENEQYIITWCIGHLLELNRPENYMDLVKVGTRWNLKRLPVLPKVHEFQYLVKGETKKQYDVVAKLLLAEEVEQVICGTDADREGQLLFQEIWDKVGCNKPIHRLWISSLTEEAIREGMSKLRPAQEVIGLAQAGYGRAYADWDFGMNLTEGFTSLFGSFDTVRKKPNVISIGRVQTPTLALVVEREWEILDFKPEKYLEIEAEFKAKKGSYKGKWFDPKAKSSSSNNSSNQGEAQDHNQKETLDPKRAEEIVAKVKGKEGRVQALKEKEVSEPHPLLFDLTSLTVTASKRLGFGADKVLKTAQSLYEKKAITYPRTDCNFLPPDILPKLPSHLNALKEGPYQSIVQKVSGKSLPGGKRVINEITAHHAIIPTNERIQLTKLTPDEQKLYELIVLRFLTIWFPPARYKETEVITNVEEESFQSKGKMLLELGWKEVEKPTTTKTKTAKEELPLLSIDENVETKKCSILKKETKPPKRYTQGDLIKAMEGAGKSIEDENLRQQLKGKGIGTVATRSNIIENLLARGYLTQNKNTLIPTQKGISLIKLIKERLPQSRLLISAEMTGQLEYELSRVEGGEVPLEKYMQNVEDSIGRIIAELVHYEKQYGKQPLVLPTKPKAAATVKKDTTLSKKAAPKDETSVKTADKNSADAESTLEILGICPACGGNIIEGKKGYGCQNWKTGCKFVLWKTPICGKAITKAQAKGLLKKGRTSLIKGFKSKSGKSFAAYLVWDNASQGKVKFEFESEKV